ncbi:hypothetical protein QEG98_42150 (plasmid) [Myxococcus sp. MxC21-1]|uniref:hypothetical protein n=1 Tax=Myxococcus sp. MxC21-1 TaxID=3041439 RepID=UPI002931B14A|nr:hypothetical protein [Myxococcus sp. MxC21-1]WNZ66224.1 hypothetical protein QEG98_42150 [Myxococcus sp. MxC21-1]
MMLVQLAVIAIFAVANVHLADRPADVVLVAPDGSSTFMNRAVAGDELIHAIQRTKGQPTDLEVVHATRQFLGLFLGVNSSTIDSTWPAALEMMDPGLAAKLQREYAEQKVLETWKAAQLRTSLSVESVALMERTDSLLHVRATATRTRSDLVTGKSPTTENLNADLVLAIGARTVQTPSGLTVRDIAVKAGQETVAIDAQSDAGTPHHP